mgnify:CR=1 FL=1
MKAPGGERAGDVIVFVPKADIERARLIREARAIYESIFPTHAPDDGAVEQAARDLVLDCDGMFSTFSPATPCRDASGS